MEFCLASLGCPQIAREAGKRTDTNCSSRNRPNIATRRQERRPVFLEQMGEQEVGSEGNGKSQGEKWAGRGCSEEAVVYTRANTHAVWMRSKPEHMVSAEEDTTQKNGRGAQSQLERSIKISRLGVSSGTAVLEHAESDHEPCSRYRLCSRVPSP